MGRGISKSYSNGIDQMINKKGRTRSVISERNMAIAFLYSSYICNSKGEFWLKYDLPYPLQYFTGKPFFSFYSIEAIWLLHQYDGVS